MNRRIFKFPLPVEPRFPIWMPEGAEILSLARQGPLPYLWASVDDRRKLKMRWFRSMTTGEVFNEEGLKFVGHIQLGGEMPKEAWYEWFVWEMDTALPRSHPDHISDRFKEDMEQARQEAGGDLDEERKPHVRVPMAARNFERTYQMCLLARSRLHSLDVTYSLFCISSTGMGLRAQSRSSRVASS